MDPEHDRQENASQLDGKYLLVVAGLLVVIMASLAMLWHAERRRRILTEKNFTHLLLQQQVRSALESRPLPRPAESVDRSTLARGTVVMNSLARQVFYLDADSGERMGFEVGDVIVVSPHDAKADPRPAAE